MAQNQDQEQAQMVQDTSSGTPRNNFTCLLQNIEQAVLQAHSLSKPELISAMQNLYAECLAITQSLGVDLIEEPIPDKTPHSELIQSMRRTMMDQRVAELRGQGWYLEVNRRPLKRGGESLIWRMRRWVKGNGKRETRYIGVAVSGRE